MSHRPKNILLFFLSFLLFAYLLQNCSDTSNPPEPTDNSELITTLKVELKDSVSGQILNYFFRDLDGPGGKGPTQWDTIYLKDSAVYLGAVKFVNESNPAAVVNVTTEIKAEEKDHIICYSPANAKLTIKITDSDGTYPLGLDTRWKTLSSSNGDLTITLRHQKGLKNGGCIVGETDVEVKFPVIIR